MIFKNIFSKLKFNNNIFKSEFGVLLKSMSSRSAADVPLNPLSLQEVIAELNKFAPLQIAEKWDNVGLLIEPFTKRQIRTIFLTNDLTLKVMDEAIEKTSDLIISYHPPIFAPLKRITQNQWKEQIVSMCLENKIALYSPHTAWDAINGGVNDWLANALPNEKVVPISKHSPELPNIGIGRLFNIPIDQQLTLKDCIEKIKKYINQPYVHVTIGYRNNIESIVNTVAVCAGSGATVLKDVNVDLYITGEMSHHELLDCQQRNINVILCNHSNTERGFLNSFQQRLTKILDNNVKIIVSQTDADPIETF